MSEKVFDVYSGVSCPFRVLQNATAQQLRDYCAEHGYRHASERDSQRGVRYWDAYVVPA